MLGVDDAVEMTVHGATNEPRLELERGRRRAEPAQQADDRARRSSRSARRGRDGRAGRPGGRRPWQAPRAIELVDRHDELEMRTGRGDTQRATRQHGAAQVGDAAMCRRRAPVECARPSGWTGAIVEAHREPADSRRACPPVPCRAQPGALGDAAAPPRRLDRGQLGPHRGDEVALRSTGGARRLGASVS